MFVDNQKNDGVFIIQKGDGLSQAIISELGLNSEQIKKLGKSVWDQIFEQVDIAINSSEVEGIAKDEKYGYKVNAGDKVRISQQFWSQITNIVNKTLKTDIKTDFLNTNEIKANIPVQHKDTIEVYSLADYETKSSYTNNKADESGKSNMPPEHINPDDYTEESLRKRFQGDKYNILIEDYEDYTVITVRDNDSGKCVIEVEIDALEISIFDDDNAISGTYDTDGNLESYWDEQDKYHNLIAEDIHDAVCEYKYGFIPTTGELGKYVNKINSSNVENVINSYKENYNKSIFSDIITEYGISIDKRIEYIKHIKDALIERYKAHGVYCDDISAEFDEELKYQKDKIGFANAEFLDVLVNQLECRCGSWRLAKNIHDHKHGARKKELKKYVNEINSDNAKRVIDIYKENYNKSIFSDIITERDISIDERVECIKHIKDALVESYKSKGVYCDDISAEFDQELKYQKDKIGFADANFLDVLIDQLNRRYKSKNNESSDIANGQIDKDFKQGKTGDCWLVATIKSIANNLKAKEALESLLSVDKDGNVTVTLKGVNKRYTFTIEELTGAKELSSGDMDVRAVEMAVNKYLHEENAHNKKRNDINQGGLGNEALKIIFGKGEYKHLEEDGAGDKLTIEDLISKIKSGNYICTVSTNTNENELPKAKDDNENDVEIRRHHAYSVTDADDKYIYLVNPHDTSQVLKMTHENFKKTFMVAYLLDVSELDSL